MTAFLGSKKWRSPWRYGSLADRGAVLREQPLDGRPARRSGLGNRMGRSSAERQRDHRVRRACGMATFHLVLDEVEVAAIAARRMMHGQRSGHLIAVPGTTIDYDWIAQALGEDGASMNIARLNYDRWRISILQQSLARFGIAVPLEPLGQGFKDMAPCS